MLIYLRQKRKRQRSPTGAQKLNGNNVRGQGRASCPKGPGIIRDTLMTGVLDYPGQRVRLGHLGEGKQVLRVLAYFRNQLRFLVFKKSHGFQRKSHRKIRRSLSFSWPDSLNTDPRESGPLLSSPRPAQSYPTRRTGQSLWLGGRRGSGGQDTINLMLRLSLSIFQH